ncbi:MAG: DNA primase [Candidatus Liptonbacteria bacterium]|nr:DNA primase [Candidatus Liptonbacteria bacterium]
MAGSTPVELIKEKLDIVEFLRGYLQLQQAGKNFKARCPFHKEKTPSFMVSPDRQSWHCFGCALGGDVFSFIMRYENVEFGEALRVLAEKAGVELKRLNPSEYKLTGALHELNTLAKDFYHTQLTAYAPARDYLYSRSLKLETIDRFELGWAPPGPEALTLHLINTGGCTPDEIIQAGLAFRTERGLVIDRFRGRVMFPIHNHFGKIAGFTGRILPRPELVEGPAAPEIAKYVNTPETPIFQKSKLLYGFWAAKNAIRDAKSAFIVEGQMDCIMSAQAGVPNAVASSGTALTADHLKTLRRVADEVVFSFDNDEAGWAAGERAIDLAQAEDFHVKVVTWKDVKDPAEAAAANPEAMQQAVVEAKPAPLFYFEKYLSGVTDFSDREGLSRLRAVLRKIQAIPSAVLRDFWLKELSRRVAIDENVLREEVGKLAEEKAPLNAPVHAVPAEALAKAGSRLDLLSERVLAYAVARGDLAAAGMCIDYFPPLYRRGFELLREGKKASGDPELDAVLNVVFLREGTFTEEEAGALREELEKEHFRRRREELTRAVRLAESRGDEPAVRSALDELRKIPHNA